MTNPVPLREKGLGAHYVYDGRAAAYRMSDDLRAADLRQASTEYVLHEKGPILDQGREGACVSYGHAAVTNAGPVRPAAMLQNGDAQRLYYRARQLDEWPGEDYDGTSNQAGAKAYREAGFYSSFVWASNPDEMYAWVATKGPVAFTTEWRDGMYQTDAEGVLTMRGAPVGGHLMAVIGRDGPRRRSIVQNSWGEDFGIGGICYVPDDVMVQMYRSGFWSACAPTEIGQTDPAPSAERVRVAVNTLAKNIDRYVNHDLTITRRDRYGNTHDLWDADAIVEGE